ncbi:MAG: adenosylcobinamide-GDP ribazoletransferase [Minwuia sp.]|uniref:adenosylcobinamide-GDP ribazoletransferase n=1 Tax=Minwuia sp. TaxID=2493630 RepID=UPI003A891D93
MNISRMNDDLAVALGWLTRLPVAFPASAQPLGMAAWAFPVVGVMLGAAGAAIFGLAGWLGAPPLLCAVLAVGALTVLTGGLHEDGLADYFDGLGARGGKAEKLAAMRDSRIGSYGVLALLFVTLARIAALAALEHALILIPALALSRASMAMLMRRYPRARADGAAATAGETGLAAMTVALVIAVATVLLLAVPAGYGLAGLVLGPLLAVAVTDRIGSLAEKRFGGVTGDVYGAACLLSEAAVLVLFIMAAA